MLRSSGSCHQTSGSILYDLQPLQQLVANTSQQTVAAVQSIADKSVNKCLYTIDLIDFATRKTEAYRKITTANSDTEVYRNFHQPQT